LIHGETVRAYVVYRPGVKRPTTAELMQFARARVGYKAPEDIRVLDEMPTNAVGKVDRVVLKQIADAAVNRHLT
jgi:acyl-coenzyme A synthetase/AMP-(fatty) acid ligase